MNERIFDRKYRKFYEGLKRTKSAMILNSLFMLRRMIFVHSVYMNQIVSIQIIVFALSTQFYWMYLLLSRPYISRQQNFQETFNDLTIFIEGYHLICLTDFVLYPEVKFAVGYSMILVVVVNLIFGIVPVVGQVFKTVKLSIKRRQMLKLDR